MASIRSFASIVHPDDAGTAPVEEAIATGRSFGLEYRLVHKSGEVRWVLLVSFASIGSIGGSIANVPGANTGSSVFLRGDEGDEGWRRAIARF